MENWSEQFWSCLRSLFVTVTLERKARLVSYVSGMAGKAAGDVMGIMKSAVGLIHLLAEIVRYRMEIYFHCNRIEHPVINCAVIGRRISSSQWRKFCDEMPPTIGI